MIPRLVLLLALTLPSACGSGTARDERGPAAGPPVVAEAFITESFVDANLDSMAVWRPPGGGREELLVTAKSTDDLFVFDAADGRLLRRIGRSGSGLGQFRRPNGILVEGELVLVVERDNRRLQVLSLPGDRPLGVFGADVLQRPYGLAAFADPDDAGRLVVYVTDNYETPDGGIPPDAELGQRVHQFRMRVAGGRIEAEHVRAFGDTSGPGVLHKVETIAVDPAHDRVLVADEDAAVREIKIYTLDGRFTGQVIPNDLFDHEPEGLALYACGDEGYWIATDQHPADNTFQVLDRRSLRPRGSFRGAVTRQTDGIALVRGTIGPLSGGGFYAAHADAQVSAFSWDRIAETVGLPAAACPGA